MTSNLPFIFGDFYYRDCEYIDGAFVDNFPIQTLDPDIRSIGICIDLVTEVKEPTNMNFIDKIISYVDKIYTILTIPIQEREREKENKNNIDVIKIEHKNLMHYHFSLTHAEKLDLFSLGYNTAKKRMTE
jgi:hypothetical protein